MNYNAVVIPAFLSKIPILQVFLDVAGSHIERLKSYVGAFSTHIKLWYPLSELQECQVYMPEMFLHLTGKEPGLSPLGFSPSFRHC